MSTRHLPTPTLTPVAQTTMEILVTVDTNVQTPENVTPEQNVTPERTPEQIKRDDAIVKCIEKLTGLLHGAVASTDSPELTGMRAALDAMKANPYAAHMTAGIAQLQHDIDTMSGTVSLAVRSDLYSQHGQALRDVLAYIAPAPTASTLKPASKRGASSDNSPRTVYRTADEITADVEYIGAPIALIDALGHECRLTSILRNGTLKVANLKQQITALEDDPSHDACVALAQSTRVLFRKRAELKGASAA